MMFLLRSAFWLSIVLILLPSGASQPVQSPNDAGVQAFGPVSAAAAGTSTQLVIAYEGNNLLPYAQTWTTGGGWDDGVALGAATLAANTAMAIVTLDSGDLLVAYVAAGARAVGPLDRVPVAGFLNESG